MCLIAPEHTDDACCKYRLGIIEVDVCAIGSNRQSMKGFMEQLIQMIDGLKKSEAAGATYACLIQIYVFILF